MNKEIIVKKYIGAEKSNIDLLKEQFINSAKDNLVVGDTGLGKTVAFILAMKELPESNLNIFLVPNRNQAIQLEHDFKHKSVVGGITYQDIQKEIGKGERIFFVVYDMADLFINLIRNKEYDFTFNLVIDEAHCLIQDYFRKEAIQKVLELKDLVNAALYTTATPGILLHSEQLKINDTIAFKRDSKNSAFKEMTFINYKKEKKETLYEALASYILSLGSKYDGIQIRINSTKFIENFSIFFSERSNYKLYDVDSSQKEYDGKEFKNPLYDSVVRKSTLPYEKGKINIYLHTCLLDAGTNISSFEGKNILTIYVLNKHYAYNLDSIAQCLNRVRIPHDCVIFAYDRSTEEISTKGYGYIRSTQKKYLSMKRKALNQLLLAEVYELNFFEIKGDQRKDHIKTYATELLNQRNLMTGKSYNEGCFYYDESTYTIKEDKIKRENIIYTKFQNQYYFDKSSFIRDLEEMFHTSFQVMDQESLKKEYLQSLVSSQKITSEKIQNLTDQDLYDIYKKEVNSNPTLSSIKKSKYFLDLYAISEIQKVRNPAYTYTDLRENIQRFSNGESFKDQREQLEIEVLHSLCKDQKNYDIILYYWKNYDEYKRNNEKNKYIQKIQILHRSSFFKTIYSVLLGRDANRILMLLSGTKSKKDIEEYIEAYRLKTRAFEEDFSTKKTAFLSDEKAELIIFDYFTKDKWNSETKELKSTTITEEVIKSIYNSIINICKIRYTEEEIMRVIKRIFQCKKEGEKIRVRGVKKNYQSVLFLH